MNKYYCINQKYYFYLLFCNPNLFDDYEVIMPRGQNFVYLMKKLTYNDIPHLLEDYLPKIRYDVNYDRYIYGDE